MSTEHPVIDPRAMPEPCECHAWCCDGRVGWPNGHHQKCPKQPKPSRIMTLKVSPELLIEHWLRLPDAQLLGTRMKRDFVDEPGELVLAVNVGGAPADAVGMEPIYTSRQRGDGNWDYYLSGITWKLTDGTTTTQTFDAPHASCGVSVTGGELGDDHCRLRHRGHTCNRIVHNRGNMHYCSCLYSWPFAVHEEAAG